MIYLENDSTFSQRLFIPRPEAPTTPTTGHTVMLQDKDYNITENGTTRIHPDTGYDGISGGTIGVYVSAATGVTFESVNIEENGFYVPTGNSVFTGVTVNVDEGGLFEQGYASGYTDGYATGSTVGYETGYSSGSTDGYNSGYTIGYNSGEAIGFESGYTSGETIGYNSGYTAGESYQKSLLTSTAFTENGSYTSENGFSAVTVNVQANDRLPMFFRNEVSAITASDLSGLTTIKEYQFYQLSNLQSVQLPSTVTSLKNFCFAGTHINSIDVSNVTSYYNGVFASCHTLTSITGFENFKGSAVPNLFEDCTGLTGVLRTNMNSLNFQYVFKNCKSLSSIIFDSNVTQIGASYNFPFNGCTGIESLVFTGVTVVPQLGSTSQFTAFTQNYEIQVPEPIYDVWTATTNWSNSNIVPHIRPYSGSPDNLLVTINFTTTAPSASLTLPSNRNNYTFVSSAATGYTIYTSKVVNIGSSISDKGIIVNSDSVGGIIEIGEGVEYISNCTSSTNKAFINGNNQKVKEIIMPSSFKGGQGGSTPNYLYNGINDVANLKLTFKSPTPPTWLTMGDSTQNKTIYVPSGSEAAYDAWLQTLPSNFRTWHAEAITA